MAAIALSLQRSLPIPIFMRAHNAEKLTSVPTPQAANPLETEWQTHCQKYLPINPDRGIWRFHRVQNPDDPEQGWKLHISATIFSANPVFKRVAPLLSRSGVLFKAPRSIEELGKINSGLHYGFSQVGKFITVYPRTPHQALSLANKLHELTRGFACPAVPYDIGFKTGGCVYYRYGVFGDAQIKKGRRMVSALRMPDGTLVPDRREPGHAVPSWLTDPLTNGRRRTTPKKSTHLMVTTRAYEAISQRGKGGVYRALDLSVAPARLCLLKEGRRHGETDYFGRDGHWRVKHERAVLAALIEEGVSVPRVYRTFEVECHYYLVTEFVEGESLQRISLDRKRPLSLADALRYAKQATRLVERIHASGWVWRDCKPLNLIVSRRSVLRPVDFEGACEISVPDPTPWGTPGFTAPKLVNEPKYLRAADDLYALGATIYQLLTGRSPSTKRFPRLLDSTDGRIPAAVIKLTNSLLDPEPLRRPSAAMASRVFKTLAK